jgi:hypothetical protein
MIRAPYYGRVAVCLLFIFSACKDSSNDLTGPIESDGPVSYASDIQPIFSSRCSGAECHIPNSMSGVTLSGYDLVLASVGEQYGTRIVVPGDADSSPIVDKILPNPTHGERMPRGRSALSSDEIARIREWINDGAPNN